MPSDVENTRRLYAQIETLKHLSVLSLQARAAPTTPPAPLPPLDSPLHAETLAVNLLIRAQTIAEKIATHPIPPPVRVEDPLSDFYARLREIRHLHRNTPAGRDVDLLQEVLEESKIIWSGEEAGGKCLDLLTFYQQYLNLAKVNAEKVDYLTYVKRNVLQFDDIAPAVRLGRAYLNYIEGLENYLTDFSKRAHPLDDVPQYVDGDRRKVLEEMHKELGEIAAMQPEQLVEKHKAEELKGLLLKFGLKCGGLPIHRATRLRAAAAKLRIGKHIAHERTIAFHLETILEPERKETIATIEKKHSLTYTELENERRQLDAGAAADSLSDDDENKALYNPKDLPLGWDGKPIPYWMYKLHGLNHEFKCEICGNATYKGPRAFERHFTEAQHVSGLRRLGIGYTRAFMMITEIEDARRLDARLRSETEMQDVQGEWEDEEGNVMDWKTMQHMKRQGLL